MILNLGCGSDKMRGAVNVDRDVSCRPDKVMDLDVLPWGFEDESASEIYLNRAMDFLHPGLLELARELKRVLEFGGVAHIYNTNNFNWRHRLAFLVGRFGCAHGFQVNHSYLVKPSFVKGVLELNDFYVDLKSDGFLSRLLPDLFLKELKIVATKRRG